jgi:hypothetical protein
MLSDLGAAAPLSALVNPAAAPVFRRESRAARSVVHLLQGQGSGRSVSRVACSVGRSSVVGLLDRALGSAEEVGELVVAGALGVPEVRIERDTVL